MKGLTEIYSFYIQIMINILTVSLSYVV